MQVQPVRSYTPNFNGIGHRLVRMSKMSEAAKNVADRFSKEVEEKGSSWREIARNMFRD
mgnify:FL=1